MGAQRDHKALLQIEWEILVHSLKENRPEDYSAQNLVKVGVKKKIVLQKQIAISGLESLIT